jgi:hypothetical protein
MAGFFTQDLMQSYPWLARIQQKAEQRKAMAQQGSQQAQPTARARQGGGGLYAQTDVQARQAEALRALDGMGKGGISAPSTDSSYGMQGRGRPLVPWMPGDSSMMDASVGGWSPNEDGSLGGFVRQDPWAQPYTIEQTALGKYYDDREKREQAAYNEATTFYPHGTPSEVEEAQREIRSRMFWGEQEKRKQSDMKDPAYAQYAEKQKAYEARDAEYNAEKYRKEEAMGEKLRALKYWNDNPNVDPWGI